MDPPPRPQSSILTSPPELTPLEQEVLEEYERLAENMKKVPNHPLTCLSSFSTPLQVAV
jgi:DASH complex subunit DAD3